MSKLMTPVEELMAEREIALHNLQRAKTDVVSRQEEVDRIQHQLEGARYDELEQRSYDGGVPYA